MYNISLALLTLLRTRNYLELLTFNASSTKSLQACKTVSNIRLVQHTYANYMPNVYIILAENIETAAWCSHYTDELVHAHRFTKSVLL